MSHHLDATSKDPKPCQVLPDRFRYSLSPKFLVATSGAFEEGTRRMFVTGVNSSFQNRLLAELSPEASGDLEKHFQRVQLGASQVLVEYNSNISFAYFIERGSASVIVPAQKRWSEVLSLGWRDMAGYPILLDTDRSPHHAVMRGSGQALRIDAKHLREVLDQNTEVRSNVLNYIQRVLDRSNQLIACNLRHDVERRLCRWLIEVSDDCRSEELQLTHEEIASALDVRRASVSISLGKLETLDLIGGRRGYLTVRSRQGLRELACDCVRE